MEMPQPKQNRFRRGLRGIRRDRDCRNCKSRGVKCDLNRPRCLPCVQAGLTCGGYPQRVVWASDKTLGTSKGPGSYETARDQAPDLLGIQYATIPGNQKVLSLAPSTPSTQPLMCSSTLQGANKRHAIGLPGDENRTNDQNWFTQRLSTLCEGFKIQGAIAAGTTAHLLDQVEEILRSHTACRTLSTSKSLYQSLSPRSGSMALDSAKDGAKVILEVRFIDALASLNKVLENADPVAFLAILVLAYYEVISAGSFGDWGVHLQGARSLLDHHCQSSEDLEILRHSIANLPEVIAYLSWWDLSGVVIRHLGGGRVESKERLIFLDWHRAFIGVEFFDTVGCPPEVFQLFLSLAKTVNSSREIQEKDDCITDQCRQILAMGQLLRLGLSTDDQGLCNDSWRCAAAIAFLTWDYSFRHTSPLIPKLQHTALLSAVDRTCGAISSVPPTSRFYVHMAIPAFLAGINATSLTQCNVLREFWLNCQTSDVPRHPGALAQCEAIWARIPIA